MGTIRIPPSGGGIPDGTIKTYSVDTALTSADAGKAILCNPSTYMLKLSLPDATTMTTGAYKFLFRNVSEYTVLLYDNAGTHIAKILDNGMLTLHLKDNSTAAGVWSPSEKYRLSGTTLGENYYPQELYDRGSGPEMNPRWVEYDTLPCYPTGAIAAFDNTNYVLIANIPTASVSLYPLIAQYTSKGKWRYVDRLSSGSTSIQNYAFAVTTSATQGAIVYRNSSNYPALKPIVVNADGKITSWGSEQVINSAACTSIHAARLPGTNKLVVVYDRPSAQTKLGGAVCTESSGTYSISTYAPSGDPDLGIAYLKVVGISSTMSVLVGVENGGVGNFARTFSSAGTFGTSTVTTGFNPTNASLSGLSSTSVLAIGQNASSYPVALPLTISGSSVSIGTVYVVKSNNTVGVTSAVAISSTDTIVDCSIYTYNQDERTPFSVRLSLNAGVVTVGTLEYTSAEDGKNARLLCTPGNGLVFSATATRKNYFVTSGSSQLVWNAKMRAFTQTLTAPSITAEGVAI